MRFIASATRAPLHSVWHGAQSEGGDMDCPSGKVIHTLKTATEAANRARRRTETPIAPYRCTVCGGWHVGTRSGLKRPVKTIYDNHQLRMT